MTQKPILRVLAVAVLLMLIHSCKEDDTDTCCGPLPVESMYFPGENEKWESQLPEDLDWNTDSIESLYEMLDANGTRAFIVLHKGKIILENYWGKNISGTEDFTEESFWYWASAGKTLKTFSCLQAAEQGYLNLTDKTSKYLGDGWTSLPKEKEDNITIWHQLTMTSGLDDSKGDALAPENLTYLADAGTRWSYHNAPYTLLEKVVSEATSQPYDSFFRNEIRDKIGMRGFFRWSEENHVYWSDARSAARFGLLMLNNGTWDQTALLDESLLSDAIVPSQDINKSYGYLWWLNGQETYMIPQVQTVFNGPMLKNAPEDVYSAMGKNGQFISISPSNDLVVVRMGESPSQALVPLFFLDDIWGKLKGVVK